MADMRPAALIALALMFLLSAMNVMVLGDSSSALCDLDCVDVEEADNACGSMLCAEEMEIEALCSEECMEALEALMMAGESCNSKKDRDTFLDTMDNFQEMVSGWLRLLTNENRRTGCVCR